MQLLSPRQCNIVSNSLVHGDTLILEAVREAGEVQCDADKIAVLSKS